MGRCFLSFQTKFQTFSRLFASSSSVAAAAGKNCTATCDRRFVFSFFAFSFFLSAENLGRLVRFIKFEKNQPFSARPNSLRGPARRASRTRDRSLKGLEERPLGFRHAWSVPLTPTNESPVIKGPPRRIDATSAIMKPFAFIKKRNLPNSYD